MSVPKLHSRRSDYQCPDVLLFLFFKKFYCFEYSSIRTYAFLFLFLMCEEKYNFFLIFLKIFFVFLHTNGW